MKNVTLNVKIFSTYPYEDASFRQRMLPLEKYLKSKKISVTTDSIFTSWMFLNRSKSMFHRFVISILLILRLSLRLLNILKISKNDCLVIHREIFPIFLPRFENFAIDRSKKSILDFDDAIFCHPSQGRDWRARFRDANRFGELVKRVDLVVAASPYLATWASSYSDEVVVRLTLPPERQRIVFNKVPKKIIWIGSDSGEIHLRSVQNLLVKLASELNTEIVVLTGHGMLRSTWPSSFSMKLWSQDLENSILSEPCIGIMPLIEDNWSKGKGAYKLMQYMSAGIPFVASNVGINREIFADLQSGFIVDSDQSWEISLRSLLTDAKICNQYGMNGFNWMTNQINTNSFDFLLKLLWIDKNEL